MSQAQDKQSDKHSVASGVEALIERLKQDGVAAGQQEAERVIAEAQKRADWIVNQAKSEAELIQKETLKQVEQNKKAAYEALRVAARDTVLQMKDGLVRRFSAKFQHLVTAQMDDTTLIRQMILEVAGKARQDASIDEEENISIVLPRDAVGLEELRDSPDKVTQGQLGQFVQSLVGTMFREGMTFNTSDNFQEGIRIRLEDKGVEIDLSEKAVSKFLLQHLQPRFRALLDGVIR